MAARTFPEECIHFQSEQQEGQSLSNEVAQTLSQDTTYRIQESVHNALHFMRHAKRQNLLPSDINLALKWSSNESVLGSSSGTVPQMTTEGSGVYTVKDSEVQLRDVLQQEVPQSKRPTLKGSWYCLEGEVLNPSGVSMKYERNSREAEEKYLYLLTDAIQGENEDMRRTVFVDIRSNLGITAILPQLIQFVLNAVENRYNVTSLQMHRILRTLVAIAGNTSLYLEPYVPKVVDGMLALLLDPMTLEPQERCNHWNVRELVAVCLSDFLKKSLCSRKQLYAEICSRLEQHLTPILLSFPSVYGVVLTACYLGREVLMEIIFPNMEKLNEHVSLAVKSQEARQEAMKVHEALLLAARLLILDEPAADPIRSSLPAVGKSVEERHEQMDTTDSVTPKLRNDSEAKIGIYDRLMGMYGEELLWTLLPVNTRTTSSKGGKKEDSKMTIEVKPSGSANTPEERLQDSFFKTLTTRVEIQPVQPSFGRPVVCFAVPNSGRARPINVFEHAEEPRDIRKRTEVKLAKGKMRGTTSKTDTSSRFGKKLFDNFNGELKGEWL